MDIKIDPAAHIGAVHLTIRNLERSISFYENSLGFTLRSRQDGEARLGTQAHDLIALQENPEAQQTTGTTGLYHFAVLVPSRLELAEVLRRLSATQTPVSGFADHGVSEAIYLPDADGNGIEMYRDRPRDEWPRNPDGTITMTTDPLDLEGIVAGLEGYDDPWPGLHADTVMGHMHLRVADISQAEAFYLNTLGFDLIKHYPGSASFISAGGYHHHIGMNTWESRGGPPPPPDAVGLRWYELRLPGADSVGKVADQVRKAGGDFEETDSGLLLRDPSQNGVMLVSE